MKKLLFIIATLACLASCADGNDWDEDRIPVCAEQDNAAENNP